MKNVCRPVKTVIIISREVRMVDNLSPLHASMKHSRSNVLVSGGVGGDAAGIVVSNQVRTRRGG